MMLIRTCLLLLFTIIIKGKHLNGQPSNKFTLVIKSKFPIGNHIGVGEAIFSEHSWASSFKNDSAAYIAGKYIFSGKLLYPTAVRIFSLDTKFKFNELLFVDTGYQEYTLIVNDSLVELNRPQTKIEKEITGF